jgi:hypothetical protein
MKINYKNYKHKLLSYFKKYYLIHKEKIKVNHKDYNIKNKGRIASKQKEYNNKHKQEIREYKYIWLKKYRKIHTAELKSKARIYSRIRRRNDIIFRVKCNLRKRIWDALKNNIKSKRTGKLLGCSIEFLKQHLGNKFKPGMSWFNYGKWEIDHIKPCAKFDLSKPSEQRKCFNYTNLQPLWMKDNRIKH